VLKQWSAWGTRASQLSTLNPQPPSIWPDNESSRWIFRRAAHRADGQLLAMAWFTTPGHERHRRRRRNIRRLPRELGRLGAQLRHVIPREFTHVILGLLGIVLVILALAFRSGKPSPLIVTTASSSPASRRHVALRHAVEFFDLAACSSSSAPAPITASSSSSREAKRRRRPAAQRELASSSASAPHPPPRASHHQLGHNMGLASLGQTCALGLLIDALISLFPPPPRLALLHRQ